MKINEFKNKASLGFSLLEMIIVVAIIAMISTFGYSSFEQFNQSKNFKLSYNDLINNLNEVRSDTVSEINAGQCGTTKTFMGYGLTIVNAHNYSIGYVCATDPSNSSTYDTPVQTKAVVLPTEITISMLNSGGVQASSLLFFSPYASLSSSYSISLAYKDQFLGFVIDQNGLINR